MSPLRHGWHGRALLGPALALLLGLAAAGCSSGASETTTAGTGASARDKAVQFAQCMRDNGVAAFPDPDASGELTLDGVVNGSSLDPDGAAWKRAIGACKDLEPAGFTGGGKRSASEQEHALAFARCIREHGVKDFPDPVDGEPLVDTNRIPSADTDAGMRILNAAMQACRDLGASAGARP